MNQITTPDTTTLHPRHARASATARLSAAALAAAALLLCSCASPVSNEPASYWVPSAGPSFATLGRSTTYALVHREGIDLLVLEEPLPDEGGESLDRRLTWLVQVPEVTGFDTPVEVGPGALPGWVLEQLDGRSAHASPLTGTVIIHHRDAERLSATLQLEAEGAPASAGVVSRPKVGVWRRADFERYVPGTPQYQEMGPRSGTR
jgi:hypothetical protein